MHVAVIGAGGAARSLVAALDHAGAATIVVANRTPGKIGPVVALAPLTARPVGDDVAAELKAAELIVNATSVGFDSTDLPIDSAVLHPEHLVARSTGSACSSTRPPSSSSCGSATYQTSR